MDLGIQQFEVKYTDGDIPRFLAIKHPLRQKILVGRYRNGEKIPTEKALCRQYNVSRITVQRALRDLVEEGLLVREKGRGAFVQVRRSAEQAKRVGMFYYQRRDGQASTYDQVAVGAESAARQRGYDLVQQNYLEEPTLALQNAIALNEKRPVGSLLIPSLTPSNQRINLDVLKAFLGTGQKVVVVDTRPENFEDAAVSYITSENRRGACELTRHLISLGYTRIAFLAGPSTDAQRQRKLGYEQAMKEADLPIRPEYDLKSGSDNVDEQGIQEVHVFLAMRQPPEAIVCICDLIAFNVIRHLQHLGQRVPDDIAVVGFDDLPQAQKMLPPLTTVHQNLYEMGERAMELLLEQVQNERSLPVVERLPCRLVVRESCGDRRRTASDV